MRIRPRTRPVGRGQRRALPAAVALLLLAPACGADLRRPDADTTWPAEEIRHWQWQWQLTGVLDPAVPADVFLLDPVTTTTAQTAELRDRDRDRRLICQVHVGSVLATDPDATRFPATVQGTPASRPQSRWLDVRQWDTLRPVLADRFRLCRGKGFAAVAIADADGYAHRSGFPLGFDDQLHFNRNLAELARSLDLSPGLVNAVPQVAALAPDFDFAVNEECVRLGVCAKLLPFVEADKPVFHVEYTGSTEEFCVTTVGYGFTSIRKERALGAWRQSCPAP